MRKPRAKATKGKTTGAKSSKSSFKKFASRVFDLVEDIVWEVPRTWRYRLITLGPLLLPIGSVVALCLGSLFLSVMFLVISFIYAGVLLYAGEYRHGYTR